jgi:hypothetical protein
LLSHLGRFFNFSRNGTPVGRGHALHQGRMPPIFALSHFPCSIRLITKRLLLFPTSHCRSSMGLPYGRLAMHCTWRSNDFSTFHVIAFSRQLRWNPYAGGPSISCRQLENLHPDHACKHKEACLRPDSSRRSILD